MQKAIFFDRDGTLNWVLDKYYIHTIEDFRINDGVIESMKRFSDAGFIFIVISNQSGIGKNIYTIEDAEKVHAFFISELKKEEIKIAEIYFCTHHPDFSKCLCRKPDSLLIEKALGRFNIDPTKSYFIGDSERDILSAQKAGIKAIHIHQNENILPHCYKILAGNC